MTSVTNEKGKKSTEIKAQNMPKTKQTAQKKATKVVAEIKKHEMDEYDELENYRQLRSKRRRRLIFRICVFLLALIIAPIMIFFGTIIIDRDGKHDFFGYNFYIVTTGSMDPEIRVNDCVILKKVKDATTLKIGDDIGYINSQGLVVVHRIIDISYDQETREIQFITKGINNSATDQLPVNPEAIVGRKISTQHALGQVIMFFRSPIGIVLLVIIFISIIVGFYVAFWLSEDIRYIDPE